MDSVTSDDKIHMIQIGTTTITISIKRNGVDSLYLSWYERTRLKTIIDTIFYYLYNLEEIQKVC